MLCALQAPRRSFTRSTRKLGLQIHPKPEPQPQTPPARAKLRCSWGKSMSFRTYVSGFRVQGLRFMVQGVGFGASFMVQGLWLKASLGFRVFPVPGVSGFCALFSLMMAQSMPFLLHLLQRFASKIFVEIIYLLLAPAACPLALQYPSSLDILMVLQQDLSYAGVRSLLPLSSALCI